MDNLVNTLTSPDFLIAVFAAISAAAVVFALGATFRGDQIKTRIKRVALGASDARRGNGARLRGGGRKTSARFAGSPAAST